VLAWGNTLKAVSQTNRGKLETRINLNNFQRSDNRQDFPRINTKKGHYSLSHSQGGDYVYKDAVLNINQYGKTLAKITRDATTGYQHRCYGWFGDFIISGGSGGFLKIYNRQGKQVADLIGHTGEVWSIAVDGQRLVSGGSDQVLKVWDLSGLQQANPPTKIYPLLNVFVANNKAYVAWVKEGFFTASEGGAKYIGYHFNQGTNHEAIFISGDKVRDIFDRPDLVQKSLAGEDLSPYIQNIPFETLLIDR
jgi:WD40 repeat protein